MTEKRARSEARLPLARNIAGQAARARRRRPNPWTAADRERRRRVIVGGAVIAVVLVAIAARLLDRVAVPWAYRIPLDVGDFFQFVTRLGKSEWYLIPSGVFLLILLAADWRNVPQRMRLAWSELGALVGYFFCAVAVAGLITDLIKWIVGRSRPILFLPDGMLSFHPISFGYVHTSFPSGHATTVAAATVAIGLMSRRWAIPMGILAAFVAVSRVVVVAHYPSDVVGGLFVGAAYAWLLAVFLAGKGVAFRRDEQGRLRPKVAGLRLVFAGHGGARGILASLGSAIKAGFTPARRSP